LATIAASIAVIGRRSGASAAIVKRNGARVLRAVALDRQRICAQLEGLFILA
jgi:hypothetical protein